MTAEKYISDLLYRYQCVTVPGFGSFLAHKRSAQLHTSTNAFYPPTKEVSFNEQLISNDGLLAKFISDAEEISYEAALEKLDETVLSWKKLLDKKEKLILKNIGELWLNNESKIQFLPSYHLNYLASSFGLASFVSPKINREILKQEVEELEEEIPVFFTPEKREQPPYLKYAAIALLTISVGLFGFKFVKDQQQQSLQVVEQKAQDKVEKTIQQATFFNTQPVVLPSIQIDVEKEGRTHKIIAGAFRIEANAQRKVEELQKKGFKGAKHIGKNKYGLHQVIYASLTNPKEALLLLRQIKETESPDAWMLSE